jgi:adenylate cyclase
MRGPLPPEGFAEQVGVPLERVESYLSLGLLDPEGDGLLDDYDVLRLALLSHFEDQGHAPERIPAELEQESHSVAQRIFRLGKDKYTLQDAADQVGVTLEQAQELSLALGFPIDSPLDREDIEPFGHLRGLLEIGMPWEIIIEGARVFSDALRRVAQAEINMTHRVLCERMAAEGAGEKDIMVAFHEAGPTLMELSSALLQHIHEDFLVQALADHAVGHLETTSATSVRGLQETTVLFVDLALFTPLAQAQGDELAAAVLDRFDAIVRKTNMSHGGRLVKQIGDAFMLTFSEPADAVRFSIETLDEARKEHEFPALRIGINSGPVLYRGGLRRQHRQRRISSDVDGDAECHPDDGIGRYGSARSGHNGRGGGGAPSPRSGGSDGDVSSRDDTGERPRPRVRDDRSRPSRGPVGAPRSRIFVLLA